MKGTIKKDMSILFKNLHFDIVVKDTKKTYGKERVLITPKAGSGEVWVDARTISVLEALSK